MRFKIRKQNTAWLVGMGLLTTFALLAPNLTDPLAVFLLIGALGVATIGTLFDLSSAQTTLQSVSQKMARQRSGQSPQAQEAEARARSRSQYRQTEVKMVDIGMIATQMGEEGISMRRARIVSKDDDASAHLSA